MRRWIDALIAPLLPAFGGFVTFCEDADGLLELPEVREALRGAGMKLGDWDGSPEALGAWITVPDDDKPLVVVRDASKRHLVDATIANNRWESVSVGGLLPRFASEVVKSIPTTLWDRLLVLHDQERYKRPPQETAVLIGRALYGVDPEFLKHGDGWSKLLITIAANGEGLPVPIASAIREAATPPSWLNGISADSALTEPSVARSALLKISTATDEFTSHLAPSDHLLLQSLSSVVPGVVSPSAPAYNLIQEWDTRCQTAEGVLEFGKLYSESLDSGIALDERLEVNRRFGNWLMVNYGLIQSAPNPAILRLPTLLSQLDAETKADRFMFIVVDALSLQAWHHVSQRWIDDGIIARAVARVAFAVLPTITFLSRRAIFEGKLPVSFSAKDHSQALERALWKERFGPDSDYLKVEEEMGIADSVSLGKRRVCVMDVSWDKMGHALDPRYSTVKEAATIWAGRTPLRQITQRALASGYRVFLTADHGQMDCVGNGRLNVGILPEDRSKRVLMFNDESVCRSFDNDWTTAWVPTGLAKDTFPLFANDRASFDLVGAGTMSHGGMSLDEVLVPVVEVFA